jgi:hypothetical protein
MATESEEIHLLAQKHSAKFCIRLWMFARLLLPEQELRRPDDEDSTSELLKTQLYFRLLRK